VLSLLGVLSTSWLVWSAIIVAATLVFFMVLYRFMRVPFWYAAIYPLGFVMLLYIFAGAVLRGQRVEWKERQYDSA